MMRVKDINQASNERIKSVSAEEKRSDKTAPMEFHRQLTDLNNANYENYIKELTDKIFEQGEIVAKKVDVHELQKYREMITQLLNETVSNAYAFSKTDKYDPRGRHKVFAMIKKVNDRLDQLTAEVLKKESDNIRMLDIVDDVRGLLVDIFL
jgi:uncharacterized protein YaaR (DUF327 family)